MHFLDGLLPRVGGQVTVEGRRARIRGREGGGGEEERELETALGERRESRYGTLPMG